MTELFSIKFRQLLIRLSNKFIWQDSHKNNEKNGLNLKNQHFSEKKSKIVCIYQTESLILLSQNKN